MKFRRSMRLLAQRHQCNNTPHVGWRHQSRPHPGRIVDYLAAATDNRMVRAEQDIRDAGVFRAHERKDRIRCVRWRKAREHRHQPARRKPFAQPLLHHMAGCAVSDEVRHFERRQIEQTGNAGAYAVAIAVRRIVLDLANVSYHLSHPGIVAGSCG